MGKSERKREFLIAHIKYLLGNSKEEIGVLIDSTGIPNQCDFDFVCPSNHNGKLSVEFRMIAVIQKSTGMPLYYEIIDGNIIDITKIERIIEICRDHGCNVEYCIADAGYSSPKTLERLILSDLDYMTRLCPNYKFVSRALEEHRSELDNHEAAVLYNRRIAHVVNIQSVIAPDTMNGAERTGFLYLCRDVDAWYSKAKHLVNNHRLLEIGIDGYFEEQEKSGTFAILTTCELSICEVLPEYYMRQEIEQYFDCGKNYAKFLPINESSEQTLNGHFLLSFIATFINITIKNRLNNLYTIYKYTEYFQ